MKIRPKPRKYNKGEEMDESYFATNSNEDGNMSREEVTPSGGDKSGFFDTSKREFKILDKKIDSKNGLKVERKSRKMLVWHDALAFFGTFQLAHHRMGVSNECAKGFDPNQLGTW